MAAACDAVVSLLKTLEQAPQLMQHSFEEKVRVLLVILQDSSRTNSLSISHDLEEQIGVASRKAQDIIMKSLMPKSITSVICSYIWEMMVRSIRQGHEEIVIQPPEGLEKIMNEFDSLLEALSKLKQDREVQVLPASRLACGEEEITLVGHDEDLLRPEDRFTVIIDGVGNSTTPPEEVLSKSSSTTSSPGILVGLDKDLEQLRDRLTGRPTKLDVISIVGMGGIGKTTIATNLYNGSHSKQHFDIRAWIVVSQQYRVQEMFIGLLDSTKKVSGDLNNKSIQELSQQLHQSLKGRRYLIVMDDVWDTKAWDEVRRFFPDDNKGSRVILTTRLPEVARHANTIHRMSLLSPEASWNLLRGEVFGKKTFPLELETIGRKIAEDCKGLPLAIILIGRILSKGSRGRRYWQDIARDVKSAVTGSNDDEFMEILSLSYNSLPQHLQACFLYMGVFPEDHVIFVSQLIKLWIAEGFIEPIADKSLENVAEDYLKDLIDRSLIVVHRRNHIGGIKTCILHDLLRELCLKKAREEKFFQILNDVGIVSPQNRKDEQRRVSIHSNNLACPYIHDSSVRTLIYFCDDLFLRLTLSFRELRVLDALMIPFIEFPNEIVELVCLRYLAFTYRGNNMFPASISKLRNLQTLIVYRGKFSKSVGRDDILYLPSTIWEMPQLRHLLLDESFLPVDFINILENLQTLSGVINFRCTTKAFEMMPNMKKLGISYYYDSYTDWSSYEFNSFVKLDQLETLKCIFVPKFIRDTRPLDLKFEFPGNLKRLTLSGCRLSWEKMTVVSSLPNLEVLKLKDHAFVGSVWEPEEVEFSKLKLLLIHKSNLKHWNANEEHFPVLELLSLSFCYNLVEIPPEFIYIDRLHMVEMYECSPSAVASAIELQKEKLQEFDHSLTVHVNSFYDHYNSNINTSLRKGQRAFV